MQAVRPELRNSKVNLRLRVWNTGDLTFRGDSRKDSVCAKSHIATQMLPLNWVAGRAPAVKQIRAIGELEGISWAGGADWQSK
jgi:hypothetical protein